MVLDTQKKTYIVIGTGAVLVVLALAISLPLSLGKNNNLEKAKKLLEKHPLIDG